MKNAARHGWFWCKALVAVSILVMSIAGCRKSEGEASPARDSNLLAEIQAAFRRVNPRVGSPMVLELRQNPEADDGKEYVVIATAEATSEASIPDLGDELFGVFVADSSLTGVRRTLDIFPTRRWKDYRVRFAESAQGLEVVSSGATFGDEPARRLYKWAPESQPPWLVREYVAPEDTALIESD